MAGLAANSRSQGQQIAQNQAMERLKAMGMVQEQEANQMQLEQMKSERAARQQFLADPNADPLLKEMLEAALPADIVASYRDQKKAQSRAALTAGIARLGKNDQAGAYQLAQQALQAGLTEDDVKAAFSGTPYFRGMGAENEWSSFREAHPDMPVDQQIEAFGKLKGAGSKPSISTEYVGMNAFRVGREPSTGAELWREPAGTLKPGATEIASAIAAKQAAGIALGVPELAAKIDPNDRAKLVAQAKIYNASGSPMEYAILNRTIGPIDDNYAALFSQLGQLNASLARAYMGGRISQRLYERLSMHVPQPGDPPDLIADKIRSLLGPTGVLKTEEKALNDVYGAPIEGMPETRTNPTTARGASPAGTPVYVGGKLVGYTTDGKTMTPVR
jgi:hypothetical protein